MFRKIIFISLFSGIVSFYGSCIAEPINERWLGAIYSNEIQGHCPIYLNLQIVENKVTGTCVYIDGNASITGSIEDDNYTLLFHPLRFNSNINSDILLKGKRLKNSIKGECGNRSWHAKISKISLEEAGKAIDSMLYFWEKPEFGIKFGVPGPFVFFYETTNIERKSCYVQFLRQGKGKSGSVFVRPLTETNISYKDFGEKELNEGINKEKFFKNFEMQNSKLIKVGDAKAKLIEFSFDTPLPKSNRRSSGFLIVTDYNDLQYIIYAINMYPSYRNHKEASKDQELGEIISTLKINDIQNHTILSKIKSFF